MHNNSQQPDKLSDLECRLANWSPETDGLNADALLFAAGRASARPGVRRFLWPTVACGLAIVAVFLGVRLRLERAERLALAGQIQKLSPRAIPAVPAPGAPLAEDPSISDDEQANTYFTTHRLLESGVENWPDRTVVQTDKSDPTPPNSPILRVGRPDALLDP